MSARLSRDDRAETGVGTLIVFIAMILVAAVAAGVLISTASSLQEQAKSTGNSATNQVSTSLTALGVYGERHGDGTLSSDVENITVNFQLASGSPAIDLNQLRIRYSDGAHEPRDMNYTSGGIDNATFTATSLRDADSSFSSTNPVLNSNDLVRITIASVWLAPRASVSIVLVPEEGIPTPIEFTTPTTYGTAKYLSLA